MKLWDIAKAAGATALNIAFPGVGSAVVGLVNSILPDDKKLPETATGNEVDSALQSASPEDRARIIDHEFEVKLASIKETNETLRVMLEADKMSAHTTRPKIAYQAFQITAASTLIIVSLWAYAVAIENDKMVKTIQDGYPFIAVLLGSFITLLYAYFGVLRDEHKNRLNTISGNPSSGFFQSIISAIKK